MTAATAYTLYMVFALGGAAVYFLMPRLEASRTRVGGVCGAAALAAMVIWFAAALLPGPDIYFCLFSLVAVAAAARVVTHTNPVYSALYFVLVVIAVAALLVLLDAEFPAVALIIVYAGAILVTYLFVIMLARQVGTPVCDRRAREPFWAVLVGFVLMAGIAGRAGDLPPRSRPVTIPVQAAGETPLEHQASVGNTTAVGAAIMTRYVVALEIAGILLLVSMVGAIAMSRKQVSTVGISTKPRPLGEVGKEVPPF